MILLALALAAPAFTTSDVRAINTACHTPRGWLAIRRDQSVRLKPPRNADYRKLDCIVARLKALSEQRGYTVGFIGNEAR